jgi:hypothetical protein
MHLVLDTSILCGDYHLGGTSFRTLTEWLDRAERHTLNLPEIVLDEVVNKYREQLSQNCAKLNKQVAQLRYLTGSDILEPLSEDTRQQLSGGFQATLRIKLDALNTQFLPYPEIPHEKLVRRALARRKPFAASGAGYRDALIWHTILDLVRSDTSERVAFITANTKDFMDDEHRLHPDLAADLLELAVEQGRVSIYDSLDTFITEHVKPELEELEGLKVELSSGRFSGTNLIDDLSLQVRNWLASMEFEPEELGLLAEFNEPTVAGVSGLTISTVNGVFRLKEGEVLIAMEIDVEAEVHFFILKSNYYTFDEKSAPYIWNYNWNDHVMAGIELVEMTLEVSLTLKEEPVEITSLDVDANLGAVSRWTKAS